MPITLTSIYLYPMKSCAALPLQSAPIGLRGIDGDRRWMAVDANDKFLTGRQHPRLTQIRAIPDGDSLRLEAPAMPVLNLRAPASKGARVQTAVWGAAVAPLLGEEAAHAWITSWLGIAARMVHMDTDCHRAVKAKYDGKYGEDGDEVSLADAFPLVVISQASLDGLNQRLAMPVPMLRFRPNLVVSGTDAHAEDEWRRIRIGAVEFDAVKPCTRCVLTTVDFERGAFDPSGEPLRTLIGYRRAADGVRFGQNLIPRSFASVHVGDTVEIVA